MITCYRDELSSFRRHHWIRGVQYECIVHLYYTNQGFDDNLFKQFAMQF